MGQELNIAPQDEEFSEPAGLFEHLNYLQHLNTRNVLDAVQKRQAKTFAPLTLGQLRHGIVDHADIRHAPVRRSAVGFGRRR